MFHDNHSYSTCNPASCSWTLREAAGNGSSTWELTMHVKDQVGVPGPDLAPGPDLLITGIWGENSLMEDLSVCIITFQIK